MATARPNLDQGPPLPGNLQPAQANMQQLAGQDPSQQTAQSGSASLQEQVIQKLMMVEKTLTDVAGMMPAMQPAMTATIDAMRKGAGAALAAGATPPPADPMGALVNGPQAGMAPTGGQVTQ